MKEISVSVIIPCYNAASWIEHCFHSALRQSYPIAEIILVDNRSQDHTWQIISNLAKQNAPKVIAIQENRPGAPYARNAGLTIAKGKWIQFLDADDLLDPHKIGQQVALLQAHQDRKLAIIFGGHRYQRPDGQIESWPVQPPEDFYQALFTAQLGTTSTNLFLTEALREVGGWREDLASNQEYELMFRLLLRDYSACADPNLSTYVRWTPNSISADYPRRAYDAVQVKAGYCQQLVQHDQVYFEEHADFFYGNLFVAIRQLAKHSYAQSRTAVEKCLPTGYRPKSLAGNGVTVIDRFGSRFLGIYRYLVLLFLIRRGIWRPFKAVIKRWRGLC